MIIYEDDIIKVERVNDRERLWNNPPYSLLEAMCHWNKIKNQPERLNPEDGLAVCDSLNSMET